MPSSQDDSRSAVYHFLDVTDRDLRDKTTALLEAGTSFAIRSEASFMRERWPRIQLGLAPIYPNLKQ